jgi:phosphoglycolate phosphatase-like HAD superfamily hydrolase
MLGTRVGLACHSSRPRARVGVLSGGYGLDELQAAGAYRVYEDPADLLRRLDEVGARGENVDAD